MTRLTTLLGLLATVSSPVAAADTATPTFAWPTEVHAKITATIQKTNRLNDLEPKTSGPVPVVFEMHAVPDAESNQVRITFDGLELAPPVGAGWEAIDSATTQLRVLPVGLLPTFVVARDAAFLRVEDTENFRASLMALVENRLKDAPAKWRQGVADPIMRATADETLRLLTATRWYLEVGIWNGRELLRGEVLRETKMAAPPVAGNPLIPYDVQLTFIDRVPCLPGEGTARCIELEVKYEATVQGLNEMMDAILRSRGQEPGVALHEVWSEVRLVTDPDTLLPYRMHQNSTMSMSIGDGGTRTKIRQQDDLVMNYEY
jgi:hypothetical protein